MKSRTNILLISMDDKKKTTKCQSVSERREKQTTQVLKFKFKL